MTVILSERLGKVIAVKETQARSRRTPKLLARTMLFEGILTKTLAPSSFASSFNHPEQNRLGSIP